MAEARVASGPADWPIETIRAPEADALARLEWAEWGPVHKGIAELEGVPQPTRSHFSQRRQAIEEWLDEHGRDGRQSAEKAALATREAKQGYVDTPSWRAEIRARAAEHGFSLNPPYRPVALG